MKVQRFSSVFAYFCGLFLICCWSERKLAEGGKSEALTSAALDQVGQVENLVADRYEDYRASLSAADLAKEERMAEEAGASGNKLFVEWSGRGVVRHLWSWRMRIPTNTPDTASDAEKASAFFSAHGALFGLSEGSNSLVLRLSRSSVTGDATVIRFEQQLKDLPVFGAGMVVHVGRDGDIEWLAGHVIPETCVSTIDPSFTAEEAAESIGGDATTAELGWWDPEIFGKAPEEVRLAWKLFTTDGEYEVYVDSFTNQELSRKELIVRNEHKEIFFCDSCNPEDMPGNLQYDDVCHDSGDAECTLPLEGCDPKPPCYRPSWLGWQGTSEYIYNSTNVTHDYYWDRYSRDNWDNGQCGQPGHPCTDPNLHRMRAISDTNVGDCNAGWHPFTYTPAPALASFDEHSYCIDVVAHEFTHGVDESEGDLSYENCTQSKAMKEAFGDVFGEFVERYENGSVADWRHGMDCPSCPGARHTDFSNPHYYYWWCDPNEYCGGPEYDTQPNHWSHYRYDCDGHWNSTIITTVGFLVGREYSEGSYYHENGGHWVEGVGEVNAGKVWYRMLTEQLSGNATFTQFRNAMFDSCAEYLIAGDHVNCQKAVSTVGFWTSDATVGTGLFVDKVVSLSYFPIGNDNRRWLFYKGTGSNNNLYYKYRTCPVYGSCSWSNGIQFNATSDGPSSTTHGDYLWVCFRGTDGLNKCDRIDSNGNINNGPNPGSTISGPPSIARQDSILYLAYKKADGKVYWREYTTGPNWSAEYYAGFTAYSAPVIASNSEDIYFEGGSDQWLWMVYLNTNNRIAFRWYSPFYGTWSNEVLAGNPDYPTCVGRPAARVHGRRLQVACRDASNNIWYTSCPMYCTLGSQWTVPYVQQDGGAQGDMYLDAYGARDSRLYLWHRITLSNSLNWRYKWSR